MESRIRRTQRNYAMAFALAVVDQVEKGDLTYRQAQERYGIQGKSMVLTWLREHGHQDWGTVALSDRMSDRNCPEVSMPRCQAYAKPATARARGWTIVQRDCAGRWTGFTSAPGTSAVPSARPRRHGAGRGMGDARRVAAQSDGFAAPAAGCRRGRKSRRQQDRSPCLEARMKEAEIRTEHIGQGKPIADQMPIRIKSGAGYSGERRNPEDPGSWTPAFAGVTACSVVP